MTKKEFENARFSRYDTIRDDYGYQGNITSVNFEFGVIHYNDNVKKSNYGRHYSNIQYIPHENKKG